MSTQLNLFKQPTLNVVKELKETMAAAAKKSGLSREQILDRMNELAERYGIRLNKGNGRHLNLDTLEKWLNPAELERIIPAKSLPVFCAAVGDMSPLHVLVEPLGGAVVGQDELSLLEWARAYHAAKEARAKMRMLEKGF